MSYCPFCDMTKSMLKQSGHPTLVIEVDQLDNANEAKDFLNQQTKEFNNRTFPKTYINSVFIGGNSDLQKIVEEDELDQLVAKDHN